MEAPTLETLHFEYRDSYKKIPFEEIKPHIFSEVMRDVDLVVSVAHVGGCGKQPPCKKNTLPIHLPKIATHLKKTELT